jgi:hypothetical protein
MNLKAFSLLALIFVGSVQAASTLPANDPYPNQPEAVGSEIENRRELPAVPTEHTSFFAVAGFKNEAASEAGTSDNEGGALAFCNTQKWSSSCLSGLIIYRCGQYTFPLTPYGCALATAAFVGTLDLKRIDVNVDGTVYNLPVIFTGTLERMVQTPSIQAEIQDLRSYLEASAKSKSKVDFWQWMWAMNTGNFGATLQKISVLLQDTSAVEIQINYLKGIAKKHGFNAASLKAITDLDGIVYQLNSEILSEENYRSYMKLYPSADIENSVTPLIYHFYPMAYLALILQKSGFGNRLSSFIPFLFNTEYVSQTLDPLSWPLHHPAPFKIDNDFKRWKMRDIYAGYRGAIFGLGLKPRYLRNLPTLDSFQAGYAKAPYETMRRLFWVMPNP